MAASSTRETALKPALSHVEELPATHCHNCESPVQGNYCSHCGQETRLHMPSFMEFAHEFVGHYVALEGRLWGTFTRLLFRPGALTNEYLAGRRRRYVEPLRLYLTLSILFFALMRLSGIHVASIEDDADAPVAVTAKAHKADKSEKSSFKVELPDTIEHRLPVLHHAVERFNALDNDAKGKVLGDSFFHYAPYAMFCLMPLFALYLKGLYLGTGRRYGEHLLFALHTNAFAFVLFTFFMFVPEGFVKVVLFFWLLGYLPWAMQRVYHKGKWGTAWRWGALIVLHTLSLAAAILVATFAGVALVH
jgi:hypothetical protein